MCDISIHQFGGAKTCPQLESCTASPESKEKFNFFFDQAGEKVDSWPITRVKVVKLYFEKKTVGTSNSSDVCVGFAMFKVQSKFFVRCTFGYILG